MKLLDSTGHYIPDQFSRDGGDAPIRDGGDALIVPFEALEAALASWPERLGPERLGPARLGVEISNAQDIAPLTPYFSRLALIAIGFPNYMDGRGFTLAKRLRNAGYTGTLRAVGPLIAEQFAYGLACGFREFEIPEAHAERQSEAVFQGAARAFSATYQRGYAPRGGNILDARRAARQEGKNA